MTDILQKFASLSSKQQKSVYKSALIKAANILVKEARKELKVHVKHTNTKHSTKSGATYSLSKGIKGNVWKNADGATIHILGDFRLKFFEKGTKPRYVKRRKGKLLKKQAFRGNIKATRFFSNSQSVKEKEVFNSLNKYISDAIKKKFNK